MHIAPNMAEQISSPAGKIFFITASIQTATYAGLPFSK
jgi:hypothetical protein